MVKRTLVAPEVHTHYHSGKKYEIHVMLPRVKKENIDLNFSKKGFCVKAYRPDAIFSACHQLHHPVDVNKVKTKHYDVEGLLEITVPLLQPIVCKKIPIK